MTIDLKILEERKKVYHSENSEFKNQAKELIVKELGFEPDLKASIGMELLLRRQLKKLSEGAIDQNVIDSNIELLSNTIRSLIKHNIPEQAHLIKDHIDGLDIINGDY